MHTILAIVFLTAGYLQAAPVDEQQTFRGKSVAGWIGVLSDKASSKNEQQEAVWALGYFGPEAKAAAPGLVELVRKGEFKDAAVESLIRIGTGTEVTVPDVIERFVKGGCQHFSGMGAIGLDRHLKSQLVRLGGPAVPAILQILEGPDKELRVCAAEALGEIGPEARAAVPTLVRAIEQFNEAREAAIFRRVAIEALGRIGPEAKAAIPTLNRMLETETDDDIEVVKALNAIGAPPIGILLDAFLRKGDSTYALAWLGPKAIEAAPALRGVLRDKKPQVRISAATALAHIDPSATEAIPVLIEALDHWDDEALDIREVPWALAQFGPGAKAALPALIGLARKQPGNGDVLKALVLIDPEGRECVPALSLVLKEGDIECAEVAADCLGLLGPRAKDAIPALAETVTRDFKEIFYNGYQPQVSAAKALRRIGPGAKSAIPALIAALKYRYVVPARFDEAEDRDCMAAAAAAETLGSFGSEAEAAIPALIEAIQTREKDDENGVVREAAVLALGRMGPAAKAAIPVLRNLLDEKRTDSSFQSKVVIALYQLAPDGKELAEKWLAKSAIGQRRGGMGARPDGRALLLGAMGRTSFETDWQTRTLLSRLDTALAYPDPRDRGGIESCEWYFEELGHFGVAGRLAIPQLNEFQRCPNPWVRRWAGETLERIMPATPR